MNRRAFERPAWHGWVCGGGAPPSPRPSTPPPWTLGAALRRLGERPIPVPVHLAFPPSRLPKCGRREAASPGAPIPGPLAALTSKESTNSPLRYREIGRQLELGRKDANRPGFIAR